jgi:2',3'-cyclic-nucleotide 2'-phosphodiesterase (5'-nucleotidase family)
MKRLFWISSIIFLSTQQLIAQSIHDTICILQLNDVYEIAPLEQGKVGGMAKVATLVKQHESRYQTFVVLAGDFVSPSVIGTTKIDGARVNGKHMVDMMNKVGVDLVTFGNHEFDIPFNDLQQRINESQFAWVSSDVEHLVPEGAGIAAYLSPFYRTKPDTTPLPKYYTLSSSNKQFTIGFVTATIPSNPQPWVYYSDNLKSMKIAYKQVRKQSDIVVGLTHLQLADDKRMLRKLKHIRLIMGGHEHKNNYVAVRKAAIAKADANAKTMYRHLIFKDGKKIKIISTLLHVDSTVVPDPAIAADVKAWEDKAYAAFRAIGLEPSDVVYHIKGQLDGTETNNRFRRTDLGTIIAEAMLAASPQADAGLFNSGSIRIDDKIEGVMTQLDVIRTLPFGGKLIEVQMSGKLFNQMLNISNTLKGQGGFLQVSDNLNFNEEKWLLNGSPIDDSKTYTIVSSDFLFSGAEKGFDFLKQGNPEIKNIKTFSAPGDIHTDLRLAVVKYLRSIDKL